MKGIQFLYIFYDEQDKQQIQLEYKKLSYPLSITMSFMYGYDQVTLHVFSHLAKHITPEAVPLSIKSANAETGVGVTSRP